MHNEDVQTVTCRQLTVLTWKLLLPNANMALQTGHHLPHSYFCYFLQPQEQAKACHSVSSSSPCPAALLVLMLMQAKQALALFLFALGQPVSPCPGFTAVNKQIPTIQLLPQPPATSCCRCCQEGTKDLVTLIPFLPEAQPLQRSICKGNCHHVQN